MPLLQSTNPAENYEVIGQVEVSSKSEIRKATEFARKATKEWGSLDIKKRVGLIKPIVSHILKRKEEFSKLITQELGKTINHARAEVDGVVEDIEYFLEHAPKYLADEIFAKENTEQNIIHREPWGVAAVITPWNFPLMMPEWGVIPNLLCGNTVVLKPSEETPLVGQRFAELIFNLNLPVGVFNIVQGPGIVGEQLVDSEVDLIWFTGSNKVGQEIFAKAGKKFIKALMELGGSSPTIIFKDVDINDKLITDICSGRFKNCGQTCSAIKRLFVHKDNFVKTVQMLVEKVESLKMGNPISEDIDIGCLVSERQLNLLEEQIADAVSKKAKVECGGKKPKGLSGPYYFPTILTNITNDMRVTKEEVFGPVLPVVPFSDEDEVIEMANDTEYGLSAEVYSKDECRARRVANQIQAGRVSINSPRGSGPNCPFGGYKKSGMGREFGKWGFEELTQMKHIKIKR